MRIAYVGGSVHNSKNGNVFYTSGSAPSYHRHRRHDVVR